LALVTGKAGRMAKVVHGVVNGGDMRKANRTEDE
jgi:hypothetical protein